MAHEVRRCGPRPGRRIMAAALMWYVAGCSYDETLRPGPAPDESARWQQAPGGGGDAAYLTRWGALSDDSLWRHIEAARGIADVGLRPAGRQTGMERGRVLLSEGERSIARAAVAAQPGVEVLEADTLLPIVKVRLEGVGGITALRRLPQVEYVEPGAFVNVNGGRGLRWNDLEFGCSVSGYGGPLNSYISPGDLLPWNYRVMRIDSAWEKSSGRGTLVGIVDTGMDEKQEELLGRFATGMSAGRTFTKDATKPNLTASNPWHDTCGHGTRMASVIAAPRNGYGTVGVAWGADLYSVRVDDDVILSEIDATRMGIRRAATRARVVAMAFGTYAYYTAIAQELDYWYFNSDRILFAAAGTTNCADPWHYVTFPGTQETVTTVTAFDETGSIACNSSRGWPVDFAAVTNQPAHGLSIINPDLAGLHGSSGATAVMAGLAAIYLGMVPSATRAQVLGTLIYAASPTGGKSPLWGWGVPNALCVVAEMCTAWIEGPSLIEQSGTYAWTVRQAASDSPLAYKWSSGETTQTITRDIVVRPGMEEQVISLGVTVRDTRSGRTRTDARAVLVRSDNACPLCF